MAWVVINLGGANLLYVDSSSDYAIEDVANPPEETVDEEYVALNDGAGARLAHYSIGEAPCTLDILCLGADAGAAKLKRNALDTVITTALNGPPFPVFEYQEDASLPEPSSWNLVGGIVRPRWRLSTGEQIFGWNGLAALPARVILHLSRN